MVENGEKDPKELKGKLEELSKKMDKVAKDIEKETPYFGTIKVPTSSSSNWSLGEDYLLSDKVLYDSRRPSGDFKIRWASDDENDKIIVKSKN